MSNRAWVTLATNDSYGLGALVLAHSLRRVGSSYPAVVLITPAVTEPMRDRLRAVFAEVIIVDVLDSGDAAHLALLQRPELGITFTKIHCWNLTQYDKCVFLDADTLVVQNSDELFDREQLSAAPDVGWPDCFNSGVFVFAPSADTFAQLITFAQERGSFDGGDQGLLNSFFSDWAHGDINKHLPFIYNVTSAAFYSYLPALKHFGQNLKIIHFIGAAKPWLQQFNFESGSVDAPDHIRGLLQLWWDIFVGHVHSQLDTGMVEVEDTHDVPPALPLHDVRHQFRYQPTLDPESEFAWHHPDAQTQEDTCDKHVDITEFHDPWNVYRGNIPPNTEETNSNYEELSRIEDQEELRKYAWDYQAQEPPSTYTEQHFSQDKETNNQPTNQNQTHYTDDWQHNHFEYSQDEHKHDGHWHHEHGEHNHDWSNHDTHQHTHTHDNQIHNVGHVQHNETNYYHNYKTHEHTEHQHTNTESYIPDSHQLNEISVHHIHIDKEKKRSRRSRRLTRIDVCAEHGYMNGDVSVSESDEYDDVMPRHPYDGFYLRHRVTINARGRKVCSHEIPPTPSPSPPSSPSPTNDFAEFTEDEPLEFNDLDFQSGVAGNLARVQPGGAGPREALDELTRRQGWEAGNIDYMGADSFDNIWAKISQTLSQPRTSPPKQSPPKELAPQQAPEQVVVQSAEVVQEPIAEKVEVAKEAVPVESAAPVEAAPASVAVAPAPVQAEAPVAPAEVAEVPVPVEAAVLVEARVADVEPAATDVPVSVEAVVVDAAPIEAAPVVPVTVEAIVPDVPATVEALPAVEDAAPAKEPVKAEAPKAAVVEEPAQKTESPVVSAAAPSAADSPPLATTPSKEEAPAVPAAKTSEEAAQETRL
ncbi:probable serine/threonine-protein kinase kinX isoform X2 [Trichoplusia ni]|uniref:glycogenin glucosyltransferase n=1 Tax=Trichoplusia ni TaxID=7111 RepID=A0A7E5VV89_TRINI|nr:probable serine/threonine-protein kinase kinX isoform X2 [Trichoplusia ni]XP_026732192.1 probable serine/threonine-protein kinase kinX isoform X2 [Trichoplusia ni]